MSPSPGKRFISASEFKARCLELMDEVSATRAELVITKHGAAVARLMPIADNAASALGFLRGTVRHELSLFDSEVVMGATVSARRAGSAPATRRHSGASASTVSTSSQSKSASRLSKSSGTARSK